MKIMKYWCIARTVSHAIVLAMALCFTPIVPMIGIPVLGYTWEKTYLFVWPLVFLSACSLVPDMLVLLREKDRELVFWRSLMLEPLLAIGWWYPFLFRLWPGGDDGGGFSWILFVGPACAVSAAVSAIGAGQALKLDGKVGAGDAWPSSRRTRTILTVAVSATAGILIVWVCRWWYSLL
jgi:hypothetical protein